MFRPARGEAPAGKLGRNFSFGPTTALNTTITGERGCAGLSIPLDGIRRLAAATRKPTAKAPPAACKVGPIRRSA